MTRVRVDCFTISLDGYGAGPNQDMNNPLGVGGTELHRQGQRAIQSGKVRMRP